jgi:hypothetical protein
VLVWRPLRPDVIGIAMPRILDVVVDSCLLTRSKCIIRQITGNAGQELSGRAECRDAGCQVLKSRDAQPFIGRIALTELGYHSKSDVPKPAKELEVTYRLTDSQDVPANRGHGLGVFRTTILRPMQHQGVHILHTVTNEQQTAKRIIVPIVCKEMMAGRIAVSHSPGRRVKQTMKIRLPECSTFSYGPLEGHSPGQVVPSKVRFVVTDNAGHTAQDLLYPRCAAMAVPYNEEQMRITIFHKAPCPGSSPMEIAFSHPATIQNRTPDRYMTPADPLAHGSTVATVVMSVTSTQLTVTTALL